MNGFALNDEDRFGIMEAKIREVQNEVRELRRTQDGLHQEVKLLNQALESRGMKVYGRG